MTTRSSVVDFKEETKGKTVNLNLLGKHLQGTPNVLTVHKPVRRPKELLLLVVELPRDLPLLHSKVLCVVVS
jgi:hypothetical protein